MTDNRFDPNDPRLTAYALGELNESERAELEKQLEHCEATREAINDIRQTSDLLQSELASEPAITLTDAQRSTIQAEAECTTVSTPPTASHRSKSMAVALTTLAVIAASVLVIVLPPIRLQTQPDSSQLAYSSKTAGLELAQQAQDRPFLRSNGTRPVTSWSWWINCRRTNKRLSV